MRAARRSGDARPGELPRVWDPHRFRLVAFPSSLRPFALSLVAVVVTWSAVLLLNAAGYGVEPIGPDGSNFGVMGAAGWGPPLVRTLTVACLAVAAVAATAAACHPDHSGGRLPRAGRRAVLVVVAAIAIGLVGDLQDASHNATLKPGGYSTLGVALAGILCWSSLAACLALPFLPLEGREARRLALALAALPFVAWLVTGYATGGILLEWFANASWRGDVLYRLSASFELLLVLYVVWELISWTELVSDGSAQLAFRAGGSFGLVAALAGAKLVLVGLGYVGLLPAFLGGRAGVWQASRTDGVGSWLLALVVAAVLLVALERAGSVRARTPSIATGLVFALLAVLCLPALVAGTIDVLWRSLADFVPANPYGFGELLASVVAAGGVVAIARAQRVLPERLRGSLWVAGLLACFSSVYLVAARGFDLLSEARRGSSFNPELSLSIAAERIAAFVTAHYLLAPPAAFAVAVVLAVASHGRRHGPGADQDGPRPGLAALAFALTLGAIAILYVVPRLPQVPLGLDLEAVGATGDRLAPQYSYNVFPVSAPSWEPLLWHGPAGTFEPATLDTLLTVGLCWLLWRARRQPGRMTMVAFALVGSTVLAHSATLAPTGWAGERLFYLGLLFPVAAQFLVRGDELNRAAVRRPRVALLTLVVIVLLLTVLGYRLLTGTLDPLRGFDDVVLEHTRDFSIALFLLPLGILALAQRLNREAGGGAPAGTAADRAGEGPAQLPASPTE